MFKETKSEKLVKSDNIFNSPIVIYTWDAVVDSLSKKGMVQQIDSTPSKSNSGNMFTGLLANTFNNGVVDDTSVRTVTPKIKEFYNRLGYLEHSSSDLFEQYLKTGVGAKPIIVGYENQIIEFAAENPKAWNSVKDKVRILYPEPTVWSAHPLIVLNPKASILINALQDEDIQRIAWEKHGFRTGIAGGHNNTKALEVVGLPNNIDDIMVMPMPKPSVMDYIINSLQN